MAPHSWRTRKAGGNSATNELEECRVHTESRYVGGFPSYSRTATVREQLRTPLYLTDQARAQSARQGHVPARERNLTIKTHTTHLEQASSPSRTGSVYLPPSQSGRRSSILSATKRPTFRKNAGNTNTARLLWNIRGTPSSNDADCTSAANCGRRAFVARDAASSPSPT